MIKKIIPILIMFCLLLPIFSFAQESKIETPETFEEVKGIGNKALEIAQKKIPETLEKIWKEEVLPLWQKMGNWMKNFWNSYIGPWLESIWQKIKSIFGQEIEKRKPIIEEEFKKEKEEIKEEIKKELPKVGKSLWERFKDLIR